MGADVREDLPLDLLATTTPKGNVWHLVSVEGNTPGVGVFTLCGRSTGKNGRYIEVGCGVYSLRPSEAATCKACVRAATERGDL